MMGRACAAMSAQAGLAARWKALLGIVWLAVSLPGIVHAQSGSPDSPAALAEIAGRVLDAESRLPLRGAIVTLDPLPTSGSNPTGDNGARDFRTRTATTGDEGAYRFLGLPRGEYRITVTRLGYLAATLEVDLRQARATGLSVGLDIAPITLLPLEVTGSVPEPFARMQPRADVELGARVLTDRFRQERYLVGDTRELTHAEVIEAITLAETDLFRALQRVPGVNTRDDYTATMWTRGASWDQTRVYFDGMPLYNPTHAGWLFAAVNPDAIGAATFHPGYRSAQWGEGSAAVLDLRSRRGRAGRPVHADAELSLASARLSLDGETQNGRINWMVAARRSYVDLISNLALRVTGNDDLHIPYDFTDAIARVEGDFGRGWRGEASTILEYDFLRGDIPGLLQGNRGRWGNRAARVTMAGPAGPVQLRATAGGTAFSTLIFEMPTSEQRGSTLPTLENVIRHRTLSVEVEPRTRSGRIRKWAVGYQTVTDSVSYDGPFSLLGALLSGRTGDEATLALFTYGNSLEHSALWGERRWEVAGFLQALTGLRMEYGDSVFNGGTRRFAPRIALRAEPGWGTGVTAGWARVYQYMQDVSPAAGPIGPQLHLSAVWVLASPARVFPAVRTDLKTVGVERSWGEGWSVNLNAYQRHASGLKIPNPVPGVVSVGRDPDAEADNLARGVEGSARKLAGRWTASLGYSLGRSDLTLRPRSPEAPEYTFPASADIRHALDATGIARINQHFRLGGAFTYGSGVPFTRLLIVDGSTAPFPPRLEEPNAERTPSYASLDLLLEYSRSFRSMQVTSFAQLRNVAGRRNSVTYSGSWSCASARSATALSAARSVCDPDVGLVDQFEPGLPRLPLLGIRIAF
jgi:hypothetical protein